MAAPTNVRVESDSETTATLNWTYGGANPVSIYRALHGGSFAFVGIVPAATLTFTDLGLATATYYDYELSDDGGSTFSSVVSVQTQTCSQISGNATSMQLPRAGDGVTGQDFNNAMAQLEQQNIANVNNAQPCLVCPSNGAVVFDCTNGCNNFQVNATTDINSITINSCGQQGSIAFNIPPNTTRKICGWPAGFGFTGDECFNAPIVAGPQGRRVLVGFGGGSANKAENASSGNGYGGGIGQPSAACTCVPGSNKELTIKCCSITCSLNCSSVTKSLILKVCGGQGPYSWTRSSGVSFKKPDGTTSTTATGTTVVVVPPVNNGSGVAGTAYQTVWAYKSSNIGTCTPDSGGRLYGCNDVEIGGFTSITLPDTCNNGNINTLSQLPCATCHNDFADCTGGAASQCANSQPAGHRCGNTEFNWSGVFGGLMCDKRTAPMIAANCNPCGLQSGVTITVTDALGVSVNITLSN